MPAPRFSRAPSSVCTGFSSRAASGNTHRVQYPAKPRHGMLAEDPKPASTAKQRDATEQASTAADACTENSEQG
ncbi:hypothetical protein HaLaN_09925, partial [Haematococcus lacustris]